MRAIWGNVPKPRFQMLQNDKSTDVLIIGGGIAGLMCAYQLKANGVDCILTEATEICHGITKDTTAKITIQHGLIYDKMVKRLGEDIARLYLQAQIKAGEEYRRLCRRVECDYEITDSFVYSLHDSRAIEREVAALERLGLGAVHTDARELPFEVAGAVCLREQAQFHPLKFLYAIAEGLPIFEHTKVVELRPNKAVTNYGEISWNKMIIATHFPMLNKHGAYFLKLYQHRSYVLALKNAPKVHGMYVDESDKGLSFRNFGELLLLGGGGHRTGKEGGCWQELEAFAKEYYPGAQVAAKWATQDCMTLDSVPYIGRYSKSTPDIFVASGFNKWGMTNAMVAADILCDLVRGRENAYAEVFDPSRSMLRPQLAINAFESTMGLLKPTRPRCPHLGCALKYNKAEHSWDCSCHGSRFTQEGQLIDNPATDDHRSL